MMVTKASTLLYKVLVLQTAERVGKLGAGGALVDERDRLD
jgi:hypothetical protein